MARTVKTSITLSPEAHSIGVRLAMADRMATGSEATLSSIIDGLLIANAPKPTKRVEPARDGNKIVGYNGFYGDHQVAYEERTEGKAWEKINAYAYEELSK